MLRDVLDTVDVSAVDAVDYAAEYRRLHAPFIGVELELARSEFHLRSGGRLLRPARMH